MKILSETNQSSNSHQSLSKSNNETADSRWKSLYKIGGVAALVAAVLGIIEIVIEVSGSSLTSAPTTVIDWFTLLQTNSLLGLAILGIFETAFLPLSVLMFLSLYPALKRTNESLMAIAVILNLIGTASYLATNTAFSMLSLSNQYAAATTDAQRAMLLAAGQAMLATGQGTGSNMTFLLGSIAGLTASVVMLRSRTFSKPTAIVGIVANVLGLPGSALGLTVWSINGLLMLVWIIMVGTRLLQLGRSKLKVEATAN
jgi:hypothetical protein